MRKITMWFVTTVAVVVLLFSYRTSTMGAAGPAPAAASGNAPGIVGGSTPDAAAAGPPDGAGTSSAGGPTTAPTAGPTPRATSTPGATANLVVNGSVAQTRWGPVQVQVRIGGGKITDVTALQIPNGNRRDLEINSYAVPQLRSEALTAQSAAIDVVSGATVTSEGYINSLQAALDSAHFKG
jgi:uncharacterized protein with FMN-binding domain